MLYPAYTSSKKQSRYLENFGGINRRIKAGAGEFRDMENLLPTEYPCLSSSPLPEKILEESNIVKWTIPKYIDADLSLFSGVKKEDDGTFSIYINGEKKLGGISDVKDAFDFNGTIITYPDYKGYNYKMVSDDFKAEKKRKFASYTGDIKFETVKSSGKVDHCVITSKGSSKTLFREGDMLAISGCGNEKKNTIYPQHSADYSNEKNPVTITVISTSDAPTGFSGFTINVHVYNVNGELIGFDTDTANDSGTVSLYYPIMDFACAHKNRVWGLGASGESIYASELGSPDHFGTMGTNTVDAWYGNVGTPGKFTGLGTYQDRVLAFKEDEVHIVYGDVPSNFSIYRNYSIGCIDGKSIANAGGMLIWLYHDGFYSYSGGVPRRISDKLNTKYVSCVAFADNKRYYARCVKEDGTAEMLVYDTDYRLWNKIGVGWNDTKNVPYEAPPEDEPIMGGEYYGGVVYTYDSGGVYKLFGDEYGDFYAESAPMTFDTYRDKSVMYLYVRTIFNDDSSFLNIYTSVNDGEWVEHKGIAGADNPSTTFGGSPPFRQGRHRLPIRYSNGDSLRLRLEGHGKVTVLDIGIELIEN